jgi:hypothetical protein
MGAKSRARAIQSRPVTPVVVLVSMAFPVLFGGEIDGSRVDLQ